MRHLVALTLTIAALSAATPALAQIAPTPNPAGTPGTGTQTTTSTPPSGAASTTQSGVQAPTSGQPAVTSPNAADTTSNAASDSSLYFRTPDALSESKFTSVSNVVEWLFNIAITLGAIALVVLLLVGGVMYLMSAGNEDGAKKALHLITNAVIGLVLILIAWAVGTYILELLGLRIG